MEDSMVGLPFPASLLVTNPDPSSISEDSWGLAEQVTEEVLRCILPTLDTDETRRDIIDYVQTLIRTRVRSEVFSYGSVPLKTYLPDGDIDLTALSIPSMEESLIHDVLAVLMEEEQNENAQYELKDTQFIDAEVKLVKCLVQNIVIDISFNQLGGLCTLCFLEQIDRNVGKDHLFKRSIILVKVWCYYESRILGGHHGLLSTYALETLVLIIFHLFNSSLNGPLMVLYRFLDYFSKFDWENNCISLNGPVCKSSLPDIIAEKPEIGGDGLMLSGDFLRNCVELFSVPSRSLETDSRPFPLKHLNIIDPLKESNNLGRSVSRGNYYRIRSAFKHGARKLGRILQSPRERITYEIKKFFANTTERHGYKYGADIQNGTLIFGIKGLGTSSSSSHTETFSEDELHLKSSVVDFDDDVPEVEDKSALRYRHDVSENDINGHANDLAAFRFLSLQDTNQTTDCSPPHSNFSGSHSGKYHRVPHSYFSDSSKNIGTSCQRNVSDSVNLWLEHKGNNWAASDTASLCYNNCEDLCSIGSAILSPDANSLESLSIDFGERGLAGIDPEIESLNPLADLSGDYDSHIRSLLYAQRLYGWNLSTAAHVKRTPHTSPSQVLNTNPWDITGQSIQRCPFSQMNLNGAAAGPSVFYHANNSTSSAAQFGLEEGYIQHGTGTYIPNMNFYSVRERSSQGRGWNHAPASITQWRRLTRNNSSANAVSVTNKLKEGNAESSVQDRESRNSMEANAKLESGFHGLLPEASSKLPVNQQCSTPGLASPEMHRTLKPLSPCTKQQGIVETFFHLKSEQDFPSLHKE